MGCSLRVSHFVALYLVILVKSTKKMKEARGKKSEIREWKTGWA
jgi:hypothetical protein